MTKTIKTRKDKILYCVNKISNLSLTGVKKLIKMIDINSNLTATEIINLYKNSWKPVNRASKLYWSQRGWNEFQATIRSSKTHHGIKHRTPSPFSNEFWKTKINPKTNDFYNDEESKYESNVRRPIKKEYWLNKGFSELESEKLAYNTKKTNNIKGSNSKKDKNKNKFYSPRCIDYWLIKGFNKEQAILKVQETQSTFSLRLCIDTYGPQKGYDRWKQRQDKWQETLNNKSEDEKIELLRKKSSWKEERGNCVFYIVKLKKNDKEYIKIGLTTTNLNTRFDKHRDEIIPLEVYDIADFQKALKLEKELLLKYKNYIQKDDFFVGYTECFITNIPIELLKKDIENALQCI